MRTGYRPAAVLLAVFFMILTVVPAAGAKGGPPHPPGEEGEEAANNLSVPAIFIPGLAASPFGSVVTCTDADDSVDPTGDMGVIVDGVLEHPDYYVQGIADWQSDCGEAGVAEVAAGAEWGDNLTNAPLKQGTPIRTEIGFLAEGVEPMPGYTVVKLDPTLLDRESHYGTLGSEELFAEVRVWVSGVTLDIRNDDGTEVPADQVDFSAEINSTGRIVYGFNWQKPVAGEYTITVYAGGIELTSTDAGALIDSDGDGVFDTVTLDVSVGNKGGGGSGGKPGDKPGHGGGGGGPKGPGGPQ
jgi:hypothetical protein